MEFTFDLNVLVPQTITRIVGGRLPNNRLQKEHEENFATIVNEMGKASAHAQGLRAPITTFQKLRSASQILYVLKDTNCNSGKGAVVGILKAGYKRLFLNDPSGVPHEVEPLCVLDFYVHESRQRSGCGRKLFEAMMQAENVKPFEVAIDRPSPKFLAFLKRHYKLQSHVKQANNFVVFDQFFSTCVDVGPTTRRLSLQRQGHSPTGGGSPGHFSWKRNSTQFGDISSPARRYNLPTVERPSPFAVHNSGTGENKHSTPQRDCDFNSSLIPPPQTGSTNTKQSSQTPGVEDDGRGREDSFDWSPNQSAGQQAAKTTGSVRQRYNIITGLPATEVKWQQTLMQEVTAARKNSSHIVKQTLGATWPSRTEGDSKAPYLNMRQQQSTKGRAAVSSYGILGAPSSGFYSATTRETADLSKYSRHPSSATLPGGGDGCGKVCGNLPRQRHNAVENLLPGITGTSVGSRPPTSSFSSKAKGKGNWRTYIT